MMQREAWRARRRTAGLLGTAVSLLCISSAMAQGGDPPSGDDPYPTALATPPSREIAASIKLGPAASLAPRGQWTVVASRDVSAPGAAWLRLAFGPSDLGPDAAGGGAIIRITSLRDGAVQHLNAEQLRFGASTSAYFNGSTVRVELLACGGSPACSAFISRLTAGDFLSGASPATICGPRDDRLPADEAANARLLPLGCTAWIFDDPNHTFLTAGHCGVNASGLVEFNVPPSLPDGTIVHPSPSNQYYVEPSSVQFNAGGLGQDWAYFATFPNSETGMMPYQAQDAMYELADAIPAPDQQRIRVTGYGLSSAEIPPEWNQTQLSHTGTYAPPQGNILSYDTDTVGGNSGSPVFLADTKLVIGIHTNGGCNASGGYNQGLAITQPALQSAIANPLGLCGSGVGTPAGSLFAVGDLNNNFGAINADAATPRFALMAQTAPHMQGLAYDPAADAFFAVDSDLALWTIAAQTGIQTRLGPITGAPLGISGLGFDPQARVLYGITQLTGQLSRISTSTLAATPVGLPLPGNIGGLEFAPDLGTLFGLDDTLAGTMLVRINPATGARQNVGLLGQGLMDCNGLAYDPQTGSLCTVNAADGRVYRVNRNTGAATLLGSTGGVFGSGFGLAWRDRPADCIADYNASGGVPDDADVAAFFTDWVAGNARADVNASGGSPDDADVAAFFLAYSTGC